MSKNVNSSKLTIQEQYLKCLESTFQDHFRGNPSAKHWELYTTTGHDKDGLTMKLRLTLSWVLGLKAMELTPTEVMRNIVDEYMKYQHKSYMIAKYGSKSS